MPEPVQVIVHSVPMGVPVRRIALTVAAGAFLTAMDASAVNAVLTLIRDAFGTTIAHVQWVLIAHLLVTTGLLLIFGRLGDLIGHHTVYMAGRFIFFLGCLLCATAGNLLSLIAFRVIQGIGSAMLLANSAALLAGHLPGGRRGLGFGAKSSCLYLGLIVGPALGAWLAARYGWRAVFWMQLPVSVFVFVQAARFIPPDRPPALNLRFDFAGAASWICCLASLLWLAGRNRPEASIGMSRMLIAAASVFFLLVLIAVERRNPHALFDLSLFRRRGFSVSAVSLLICFSSSYMLTFVLPFYVMEVRHENPAVIGPLLALNGLARSVSALFSGRWSDRVDSRWLCISGLVLLALSLAFLSRADENSPAKVAIAVFTAGIGVGCFVPPNNRALMNSAPPERYGVAGGIMATSRSLGMTAGVALAGAILSSSVSGRNIGLAFATAALLALAGGAVSWFASSKVP
jgi:EmrB/QacA subfamily drug resistance transporter